LREHPSTLILKEMLAPESLKDEVRNDSLPRKPQVLIIDDDLAILRMLRIYLGRADLEVHTVTDAEEALKVFGNGKAYDCVITDAILPGTLSGFDVIRALRKQDSTGRIPILMLTRKAERESIQKAVEAGASDYILKPVDESVLIDKINQNLLRADRPKQTVSLPLAGTADGVCQMRVEAELLSISETDFWVRLPFGAPPVRRLGFHFDLPLLRKLGIELPRLNQQASRSSPDGQCIEVQYGWVGLSETQLQKIRSFIQKEQIRRRN
jgi:CheY-like chemotaxis protein